MWCYLLFLGLEQVDICMTEKLCTLMLVLGLGDKVVMCNKIVMLGETYGYLQLDGQTNLHITHDASARISEETFLA